MPVPCVEDAITEPPLTVILELLPPMPIPDLEDAVTELPSIISGL